MKRLSYIFLLIIYGTAGVLAQNIGMPADSTYLPESLTYDIDSIMDMWNGSHLIQFDSECRNDAKAGSVSDSVLAQRLSTLPTIVEMTMNNVVRSSIQAYTGRNSNIISYALGMLPFYEETFVNALIRYDVPLELKYLPIVESALKPKAYSRAGAAGMWQFIYSTGRKYDLMINSLIDDRYDVRRATDAAARHLKDLYCIFNDWDLAISAYNCGSGNVTKAIARSGKSNFWDIYPYLPRETRGYLPAFIAVNYVMNYYMDHGICPAAASISPATDTLHISRNLHIGQIEEMCGIGSDEIRAYNPQYISDIIPGAYRECVLTLPTHDILSVIQAGDSLYSFNLDKFMPKSRTAYVDDEMMNRRTYIEHRIRNGETLSGIAAKYHTTVRNIKSWNNMTSDRIRAGKTLRIYNR